jgi:hypothetical protein
MNKLFSIFLSMSLWLAGCGQANSQVTLTPTRTPIDATTTPVRINTVTPTRLSVPTLWPSPSPTIGAFIERHCPSFMGEAAMEAIARGTIFLYNSKTNTAILHDLQSGQEYPLPREGKRGVQSGDISPDRTYYAYTESNQARTRTVLWVVNAEAEVLVERIVDNDLFNLRWLDNEHISLDTQDTDTRARVVVYALQAGEFDTVAHELPELFAKSDLSYYWRVEYGPNMQTVFYLSDPQGKGFVRPIYFDLVSQKTLWESPVTNADIGIIKWSPTGQYVALMISGDLYIINAGGQIVDVLEGDQLGYITRFSYSWSPNGQYIAFWAPKDFGVDTTVTLMIYDMKAKTTVDYCITGDYTDGPPSWSPDSTQVVVNGSLGVGGLLLDLPTNRSFKLPDIPNVSYSGDWLFSISEK